ncbi:uncharacterized protein C2845_PM12G14620 [Panicum miliaceum]|uniref:Retrotransposon gag domain-containing protein n=1 Tax=Panicum miliaceum TaxID=4540 RepID=A0A3L6QH53_PANMI|nr:uncharacterized protein C2845_PM12G14620 [Panicum miliaceum]
MQTRSKLLQQQIQEKGRLLVLCYPEDEDPAETKSPHRREPQECMRSEVYDKESDLREFLLKYEATVESNGRGSAIKAKAFIMAVNISVQHWYTSIPKGHIYSWSQLRSKLLTSFLGLKTLELTSCNFHNCKQGEKETLQEYMQCIFKMRAKALNVADLTIIE